MEVRPVLKSKISVPRLPEGALVSERIKGLGIDRHRAVSVMAPAGYGKTTAVLAALEQYAGLHWYRLEQEDARLSFFYANLLESLFGRTRGRELESVQYFRSMADVEREYEPLNAVICQDVSAAFGDKRKRFVVFDDFHHVMGNERIVQSMRYFIANMPQNVHLVILSRRDTGVFDGAQGLGDVLFLTERQLCFSEEEIAQYMKDRGLVLPPGMAARVLDSTEGWISGIILLANLIGRLGTQDVESFFQAAGGKSETFRFFLAEVMQGLSPESIRTIALLSTLDEFRIAEAEAALGIKSARSVVEYCEKTNLFLQKTGSEDVAYRFHPLFRRFLLSLREEYFSPAEIAALHVKASGYYLAAGDFVRSVRHMLLAGSTGEAIRLLCQNGKKMMDSGLGEHLKMFIEELPAPVTEGNAYLSFFYGFLIVSVEFERSCSYLYRAARLFEQAGDTDMQVQVIGVLFTAFAQRNDIARIRALVDDCKRLDETIRSDDVRATLLAVRLGRAAFDEDFEEGLALGGELRNYELNDIWRYGVNNFLCMIHYRRGDLAKGKRYIEENLKMPIVQKNDQWKILTMVFCHIVACYLDDTEWSNWVRTELLRLGEKYRSGYALGFGKRGAAFARYRAHDVDQAIEFIRASASCFEDYHNEAHVRRNAMYQNLWLAQQSPEQADLDEVRAACAYLTEAPVGQGFAETAQSIAGVILREAGQDGEAEALLLQSFRVSREKKALQSMAGTAMHLAKLYYDRKDHARADAYLSTFITLSKEHGYVTYYDLFFPTLAEMAAFCAVKGMHADYAQLLISRFFGETAARHLAENAARLCSAKAARLFICRFGTAKRDEKTIRVFLLGGFRVSIGDTPIEESEWKTRKIQGILKYLLLQRGHFVSKDLLAETFWPDAGGKAAMASLNVALYELRRVLSAHGVTFEDEFTLIRDRGGGFELMPSERLIVDADRFLRLNETYRLYESGGGDVKPILVEMVELYAGDLLPQDAYEDWAMLPREHMKSRFLDAALRLSQLYTEEGAFSEAEALLVRALAAEPYSEAACEALVRLYQSTGRESAARTVRLAFAERMKG